tara:strand:+ start:214 stop:438 length:225 start_codon:yes stop_codon:yes gene_type:complete
MFAFVPQWVMVFGRLSFIAFPVIQLSLMMVLVLGSVLLLRAWLLRVLLHLLRLLRLLRWLHLQWLRIQLLLEGP